MSDASQEIEVERAVRALHNGGVVAFPTDTLYGLGADVFNPAAVEAIFTVKERPSGLALPILIDDWGQLERVAESIPDPARVLAERFWPGPLTLIVNKSARVSDRVTAGAPTVAVRIPDHPIPRAIARLLGGPITGTSANISGQPDPQNLHELTEQLGQKVDYLVTAGPPPFGAASTIVDITNDTPTLIREGAIPFDAITRLVG